jgi:hypothetical protein
MAEDHDEENKRVPDKDHLTVEDWRVLKEIHQILEPLYSVIKFLEGRAKYAIHGSVWEILPIMEYILDYFENLKIQY